MKKFIIKLLPVTVALLMFSCGEVKTDEQSPDNAEMHEHEDHNADHMEDHSSKMMEVSPEMMDFISTWDGTFKNVESALQKYGATKEIMGHEMGMFELNHPEVMSHEGDCYLMKCKSGMVENKYNICWKDGKIISIEEKM